MLSSVNIGDLAELISSAGRAQAESALVREGCISLENCASAVRSWSGGELQRPTVCFERPL